MSRPAKCGGTEHGVSKAHTFLWCTQFHTLLHISAPEGTAYTGDRASTRSSLQCRFWFWRSHTQIPAQKYFLLRVSPYYLEILAKFLPQMFFKLDHDIFFPLASNRSFAMHPTSQEVNRRPHSV